MLRILDCVIYKENEPPKYMTIALNTRRINRIDLLSIKYSGVLKLVYRLTLNNKTYVDINHNQYDSLLELVEYLNEKEQFAKKTVLAVQYGFSQMINFPNSFYNEALNQQLGREASPFLHKQLQLSTSVFGITESFQGSRHCAPARQVSSRHCAFG